MRTERLGREGSPARLRRLAASVERELAEPVVVRAWRGGVDFWVDKVDRQDGSVQVVRSPRIEVLETSYDGTVDFGDVLECEAAVLTAIAPAELPAPRVAAVHRRADVDDMTWMLQDLLPGTHPSVWTAGLSRQLGRITRAIHSIGPDPRLPHASQEEWPAWVRCRIAARLDAVRNYIELPPTDAVLAPSMALLEQRAEDAQSLLHLDLRPDNLLVESDAITGVLDFTNAVVGDPLFELARIRRYGLLDPDFLSGYGTTPLTVDAQLLLHTYELDTAALLALVGIEEVSDPELHRKNLDRTEDLCRQLASHAR